MPLTKKQKTTALVVYILGLLVFFAVVLFPEKPVRDFTENSLARFSPKVTVKVGQAGPAFPFSVKLRDFLVYYDHQPLAAAGYVKLTPTISTLLGLGTAGSFKIGLFGGGLNGSSRLEDSGAYRTEARLADLRLDEMAFVESFFRHQLYGRINGRVVTRTGKEQMEATAELELSDGRISFAAPVFGIEETRFDTVSAVIEVEGNKVRL
ncbi:MAG: type II secretion system protein GspN, partial [Desulfosudaceae bacterium]